MKKLRFYKESSGCWYVDLPDWKGSKADLQMVAGADTMLDYMAEGKDEVELFVSEEAFEGGDLLQFIKPATELGNGSYYFLDKFRGIDIKLEMWLCDVTKFVFGGYFPDEIYIAAISE